MRDPARARTVVPPAAELVRGDVTDPGSLAERSRAASSSSAPTGSRSSGSPTSAPSSASTSSGAAALVRAAAGAGARRVVHTSTIDVFEAAADGRLHEGRLATTPKGTVYERSKQRAEVAVLAAADDRDRGRHGQPRRRLRPGPARQRVARGVAVRAGDPRQPHARPVPAAGRDGARLQRRGRPGHLLAAERGEPGERYILCDGHATLHELAELVRAAAGRGRVPPVMPLAVARAVSAGGEAVARVIRRPPLLPKGQLHFLLWNAKPDAARAERELGWTPTPLAAGVERTVALLSSG